MSRQPYGSSLPFDEGTRPCQEHDADKDARDRYSGHGPELRSKPKLRCNDSEHLRSTIQEND